LRRPGRAGDCGEHRPGRRAGVGRGLCDGLGLFDSFVDVQV
jgi:hypothetical protein